MTAMDFHVLPIGHSSTKFVSQIPLIKINFRIQNSLEIKIKNFLAMEYLAIDTVA